MFTDRVVIKLQAGKGGNGVVAWRREKYVPKGGPFGGNGGNGGSIFIEADPQISSLEAYHYQKIIRAENGIAGGANNCHGKNGSDLILKVPCGTLVKNVETKELLYDLALPGERFLVCRGGRGGKGNTHFKSPTNRAPNTATKGEAGETYHIELELKLIADVGLVGFPNAGKSTLFSKLANTEVKIASYPFTTLSPNLGFIIDDEGNRTFIADIPGLIEGAHQNRGLGFEFLRHIERTRLLLFVIDLSGSEGGDPWKEFETLRKELKLYNPKLLQKPFIVALNKTDLPDALNNFHLFKDQNLDLFPVSALTGQGVADIDGFLKRKLKT